MLAAARRRNAFAKVQHLSKDYSLGFLLRRCAAASNYLFQELTTYCILILRSKINPFISV
jgi:hypothetical protein